MSDTELDEAAIKLFKDYNQMKNVLGKDINEVINKLGETLFDRGKYTDEEAKIIFCKFMILVFGQNIGG